MRLNDEDMMVGVRAHCVSLMRRGASWESVMYAIRRSTELKRVSNMAADWTAYFRNPVMSSTYTAKYESVPCDPCLLNSRVLFKGTLTSKLKGRRHLTFTSTILVFSKN